jgi:hypothetical protein
MILKQFLRDGFATKLFLQLDIWKKEIQFHEQSHKLWKGEGSKPEPPVESAQMHIVSNTIT